MRRPAPAVERILENSRARIASLDLAALARAATAERARRAPHTLRAALLKRSPALIAEIKRASPAAGTIRGEPDIVARAMAYVRGGAAAISVLTEPSHFGGALSDLEAVARAVPAPVLRKDFILDAAQIHEAAAAGAAAVLLIVRFLAPAQLEELRTLCEDRLGLDALVEVHSGEELEVARRCGATLIGVNNRDLGTLQVSLDVARGLAGQFLPGELPVAESGMRERGQVEEMARLGYRGVLVGETLMRSDDPESAVKALIPEEVRQ